MYRRKMEDMSKKLGLLLQRLNAQSIGPNEVQLLQELSMALDQADYNSALGYVRKLTTESWDENHLWILALKRLIESAMTGN